MREKPDELDSGFISPFDYADLLWTSELFVARQPLDSVPERPRGDRGNLYRVVPLKALLCPQLQAEVRIVAGFGNSSVQREKLFSAHQDLLEFEEAHRQTGSPQGCLRRNTQLFEFSRQRTRNSELLCHSSANSITLLPLYLAPYRQIIFGTARR